MAAPGTIWPRGESRGPDATRPDFVLPVVGRAIPRFGGRAASDSPGKSYAILQWGGFLLSAAADRD
jgi:hypothetical protein